MKRYNKITHMYIDSQMVPEMYLQHSNTTVSCTKKKITSNVTKQNNLIYLCMKNITFWTKILSDLLWVVGDIVLLHTLQCCCFLFLYEKCFPLYLLDEYQVKYQQAAKNFFPPFQGLSCCH